MKFVTYETEDRVGYITLNRPEKRNALNFQVVTELKEAFAQAEADEACKVMVLRANGQVFCAGADLEYMQGLQTNTYAENLEDSTHLMELFLQIYTMKKVVIGQVHGHAIAGGCGLATVCDFAYAAPEAKFGYTEVKIGFVPAIVKVFLLRKIGEGRAKELLLSGDLIDAETAHIYGLINKVVPAEKLEKHVRDFALRLCKENSGHSMGLTKQMIGKVQDLKLKKALRYAAEMNATARGSADCKKGIQTFLNKEKFIWWEL